MSVTPWRYDDAMTRMVTSHAQYAIRCISHRFELLLVLIFLVSILRGQLPSGSASMSAASRPWVAPSGYEVIENDWCRVFFEAERRHLAISVLADAGSARIKVRARLGRPVPSGVIIEIVDGSKSLVSRCRATTGSDAPEWAAAVAWPPANLVLMRADSAYPMDERVSPLLLHEFAHLAIGRSESGALTQRRSLPRWFEEGLAQWAAGSPKPMTEPDLRPAALFGTLMDRPHLEMAFLGGENAAETAYAQARSRVTQMALTAGYDSPKRVLKLILEDGLDFDTAIRVGAGYPPDLLESEWRAALRSDLSWVPGVLGQIIFALVIILAVVVGSRKIALRRTKVIEKWERESPPPEEVLPPT